MVICNSRIVVALSVLCSSARGEMVLKIRIRTGGCVVFLMHGSRADNGLGVRIRESL